MSNVAKPKSDLSRAFSEDGARKTHVGGQALLEGVMMRGKYNWAVGVRERDGGVYEESHDLASGRAKNGWMYWPCVRGCRAMVESLVLGSMHSTRTRKAMPIQLLRSGRRRPAPTEWLRRLRLASLREPRAPWWA